MYSLKRFLYLPDQDRSILIQALIALSIFRIVLPLLSLRTVERLPLSMNWRGNQIPSACRIAWAVRSAARFVPGATCLLQALTAHALLIRHGYAPRLTIGVMKDGCQRFGAHAWVTCADEVVIGGRETQKYTALLSLGS